MTAMIFPGAMSGAGDPEPSVAVMILASVFPTSRRRRTPLVSVMFSVDMIMCRIAPNGGSGRLRISRNRRICSGSMIGGSQFWKRFTIA